MHSPLIIYLLASFKTKFRLAANVASKNASQIAAHPSRRNTFTPRKADGQLQPISVTYGHTNPGITPIYSIYVSTHLQSRLSTKRQVSEPNSITNCIEKGLYSKALVLSALNVILD